MKQTIKILLAGLVLSWFSLIVLGSSHPLNIRLKAWAFDWSFSLGSWAQPVLEDSPVTIVYLDTETYLSQNQDPNLPFSRALHAKALKRLTQLGAKAVIYDIIFAGPYYSGNAEEDALFTEAITENGRVLLGADLNDSSISPGGELSYRKQQLELPYPPFLSAAADWGLVQHQIDPDFVVRTFFLGFLQNKQPSLAVSTGRFLGLDEEGLSETKRLYYYGKPYSVPYINLNALLEPEGVNPDELDEKIIFIGARPETGSFDERRDEVRSPFSSWGVNDRHFTPGVEVHATQVINLVLDDGIRIPSPTQSNLLLLTTALIFSFAAFQLSIRGMFVFSLIAFFTTALLGMGAFHEIHIEFPWTHAALFQLPIALCSNITGRSTRWYQQRLAFLKAKTVADTKINEQAILLNRAHDAIVVLQPSGERIYQNQSASRLFNPENTPLEDPNALISWDRLPAEILETARQQTIQNGLWEGEFKLIHDDRPTQRIESRWTQIQETPGHVQSILTISTDVTEKRRLEQQFLQAQRMDTIGSLAGGVAHDLNNALSPILMGVQLMRRQNPSEKAKRMLDVMEQSTQRGAEMVRQILAFTRGSGEDRQRVDLKTLIRDLEHLVKETFPKHIEISTYFASDLWPLYANPTQVHQILLNLCVNARDAMPNGGHLTIAVDKHQQKTSEAATLGTKEPGQYILLMLSDTGTGMPTETIQQIFDPFYSTKPQEEGTGLGLTTVKTIVEKHHGCIDISSEPSSGTSFEVYLPCDSQVRTQDETKPALPLPTGNGERILIADDELAVREMIASTLEASGYKAVPAGNGTEALSLLNEEPIALVILDNDMPMMSGRHCLKEIKKQRPTLPVLLISGDSTSEHSSEPLDSHCIELSKPFRVETLLEQVSQLIRKSN